MDRWNVWTRPQGTPPDALAPTGGLARAAWAHLGATLILVNVGAAIAEANGRHHVAAGVWFAGCAVITVALLRPISTASSATMRGVFGLVAAGACVYLALAAGEWTASSASPATSAFIASVVLLLAAVLAHAFRPSTGTLIVTGVGFSVSPVLLLATDPNQSRQAFAAVLVAICLAHAAVVLLPLVKDGQVFVTLSVITGVAGIAVQLSGGTPGVVEGLFVVLLLCLAWLCVERGAALALAVLVLGGAGDLSLLAGRALEFSVIAGGPAIAGALVALILADRFRRDPTGPRVGGLLLLCTWLCIAGSSVLLAESSSGANVLGGACLAALFVAGIFTGRRLIVAAVIVAAAIATPQRISTDVFGSVYGEEAALGIAGLLALAAAVGLRRRAEPATALAVLPGSEEGAPPSLAQSSRPYSAVFDALLTAAVAAGPVHLADRLRGRIAGDGLALSVWHDNGTTHVAGTVTTDTARRVVEEAGQTLSQ